MNESLEYLAPLLNGRRLPDVLNDVKLRLSSRCIDTQMSAVVFLDAALQKYLREFSIADFFLDGDIIGYLCDAMSTNCLPLLEKAASVVELLSDSNKMMLDGHAVLAAEAAQRCAHFLWQRLPADPSCEPTLITILNLIATLLSRWAEVLRESSRSVSSLCQPDGLLTVLKNVLATQLIEPTTLFGAVRCLCGALRILALERLQDGLDGLLCGCVNSSLGRLKAVVCEKEEGGEHKEGKEQDEEGEDVKEDEEDEDLEDRETRRLTAAELLCSVYDCVTRVRCVNEIIPEDEDELLDNFDSPLVAVETEALSCVMSCSVPLVQSAGFAVACGAELEGERLSCVADIIPTLLDSLQVAMDLGISRASLANTLADKFLFALPAFQRSAYLGSSHAPLRLLCSILAHLAVEHLPGSWDGSVADLAKHLFSAAPELPSDSRFWAEALTAVPFTPWAHGVGPAGAAQHFMLLLAYFKAMVGMDVAGGELSQTELTVLQDNLVKFILSLPSTKLPEVVLKALWLPFAECELAASGKEGLHGAREHLTQLLQLGGQLEAAYTHNALLLYWAFQARGVPPRVQQAVVKLWLAQAGLEEPCILSEIVRVKKQAIFPLLDVVSGGEAVAAAAAQVLLVSQVRSVSQVQPDSEVLPDSQVPELLEALWQVLPGALSRCLQDRADAELMVEGCGQLVLLAAELHQPPPAEVCLRVAHLLGAVLSRRRLEGRPRFLTAALLLAAGLVRDSCRLADQRVLGTLLSDPRLPEAVVSAVADRDRQVCAAALTLLLQLEEKSVALKAPVCSKVTPISGSLLVSCLKSKDLQVLEAAVNLLVVVLTNTTSHHVVSVNFSDASLKILYWELQNLTIKAFPNLQAAVWSTMSGLLAGHSCAYQLAQQPWNYTLIMHTLRTPLSELGHHVFVFVLEWLRKMAPRKPPQPEPRRIEPTMLTRTAVLIAKVFLSADAQFQCKPIVKQIARMLLTVTADFPPDVFDGVKRMGDDSNKK